MTGLIGSFFTKSKTKHERAFADQGKAINDYVVAEIMLCEAKENAKNRRCTVSFGGAGRQRRPMEAFLKPLEE